ncbi:Quinolinate synthetase [Dissulfuribacter thermophilus]|uniref:Quinolinate synthase n=1 Tax=Dissulfuribacter thermophilus TaxID=1156395 RepID=A0A1B9F3D7_9BACT|nr:quinolinate synthase NadA [Dissulfuribacter thermophilus]OCC14449.1 Quinolinate synthetase [Dissulfuribacter thermophilus]
MEQKKVIEEINRLRKEKNAIILAHNYQLPEIQEIADLTGDSLELSMKAAKTDADMIVFCGVSFMAETAKIVCPDKKVILSVEGAGCPMADMIDADELRQEKEKYPGVPVVTYVNSTAAVKAESDICCTSANAVKVVQSLESDTVLMTPDKNLAKWVERHTDKKILYWPGYCPIHDRLTTKAVEEARAAHPDAVVMAHPECPPEVIEVADVVRSTSGMLAYAKESSAKEFIVATEVGLIYPLEKQNPDKRFYPASPEMVCEEMKKTRLEDVLRALKEESPLTHIPEDIRKKALKAVERMLEVPRD